MPNLATNRRITHDYTILENIEAGVQLTGAEVKSAKLGQIKLRGAYVTIRGNEAWLVAAHIAPYHKATGVQRKYDPDRDRKLLLRREEIKRLIGKVNAEGLTIVPISVYTRSGLVKIEIGVARGKRKADKREALKKRQIERRIRRRMHQHT